MQDLVIGCDIEEIMRFSTDLDKNQLFLDRVFTPHELKYCFSYVDPARHLAARFCAKESVIKAFSSMGIHPISYKSVEICKGAAGAPYVRLNPDSPDFFDFNKYDISISLSHSATVAMAVAVVRKI